MAHGRQARRDAGSTRAGLRQRHRQRTQRAPRAFAHGQYLGDQASYHRPFDATGSPPTPRAWRARRHIGALRASSATVGADSAAAVQAASTAPGQIAHADPAGRHRMERGRRGPRAAAGAGAPCRRAGHPARNRAGAEEQGAAMLILYGQALSEAGLGRGQPHCACHRHETAHATQVSRMARGRGGCPWDRIRMWSRGAQVLARTST